VPARKRVFFCPFPEAERGPASPHMTGIQAGKETNIVIPEAICYGGVRPCSGPDAAGNPGFALRDRVLFLNPNKKGGPPMTCRMDEEGRVFENLKRWLKIDLGDRKDRGSGCLCCGKCCDLFGGHLQASKADLERWRTLGRQDLLGRVNRLGWIWVDPATKQRMEQCPFLRRSGPDVAQCAIHEVKPDICRAYPTLAHGRRCLRGVFLRGSLVLAALLTEAFSFPGVSQALA
jgi:Fe-S-cluster containining protein